jgi:hypothetical protein
MLLKDVSYAVGGVSQRWRRGGFLPAFEKTGSFGGSPETTAIALVGELGVVEEFGVILEQNMLW